MINFSQSDGNTDNNIDERSPLMQSSTATATVASNADYDLNSEYLLFVRTVQSSNIRILFEALKEILPDTNIEFNPKRIKILAVDAHHVVLVHLRLEGSQFEQYYCPNKQVIGISLLYFFRLIKTMNSNNDILTLFIEKNDSSRLGIRIENSDKNTTTTFKLNLLDLDEEEIEVPNAVFPSVITLQSTDFQKICRDMSNLAQTVEITSVGSELRLSCQGEFAQQETVMGKTNNEGTGGGDNEIIQGLFNLKHLVLFTRCSGLSQNISLFLSNDFPLVICYTLNIGSIKFCLAPKNDVATNF